MIMKTSVMKTSVLTVIAVVFLMGSALAQSSSKIPLIGSEAPSFTALSTNGKMKFPNDFGKSWKILFSHPQDFTPVCSSELLELAYLQNDFDKLNVKIAIISTDNVETHNQWLAHLEEIDYKNRGKQDIKFPVIDDHEKSASRLYGMLHEPVSTNRDIRGVFIIDPQNKIRSVNFYPMEVGRNLDEIVRLVEALQTVDQAKVLTPANWENGGDVMVPYFPYTKEQLAENPGLKDEFYNMGNRMWFKKVDK
jgi:peroxiredoxin (alkyl hydroperoxide reductase subunit C)